jgi:IS6 family transposase
LRWSIVVGRQTDPVTSSGSSSVFAGFRFPREVISLAVRWYLRYGLSYRDVEELLAERGITVDHVTIYRWVQRFTPEFIEAARPARHLPGDRWFADETYLKVAGTWAYLYRAIDQHGQVVDVLLSDRRDLAAARRFFTHALRAGTVPAEVTTDRAPVYPRVLDELIPSALHTVERYANNPIEADHGLCVPRTLSTSCDQAMFADQATGASVSSDAVLARSTGSGSGFSGAALCRKRCGRC